MLSEFERHAMVDQQIIRRGIHDPRVIDAMRCVAREFFVPEESHGLANEDCALEIGYGQTISQPYIVALMTELLRLPEHATVLEIGAGSGYQTAVLAHISDHVCAIEKLPELADSAQKCLDGLGFSHIDLRCGDGFKGWPDEPSQFDGILAACAPNKVPYRLLEQLRPGASLVIPVGPAGKAQDLMIFLKDPDGHITSSVHSKVHFVPMVEEAQIGRETR